MVVKSGAVLRQQVTNGDHFEIVTAEEEDEGHRANQPRRR